MIYKILKQLVLFLSISVAWFHPVSSYAQEPYLPAKVIYDVLTPDIDKLNNILDRASLLQNIYKGDSFSASIIIMIHGNAIPVFSKEHKNSHQLIKRAYSLYFWRNHTFQTMRNFCQDAGL